MCTSKVYTDLLMHNTFMHFRNHIHVISFCFDKTLNTSNNFQCLLHKLCFFSLSFCIGGVYWNQINRKIRSPNYSLPHILLDVQRLVIKIIVVHGSQKNICAIYTVDTTMQALKYVNLFLELYESITCIYFM